MKRILLSIFCIVAVFACSNKKNEEQNQTKLLHPEWCYNATIYELNTRQFTPEGTFKAATAELERLENLGVNLIWVMPIQPIGVKERKGELGSYYAIRDYCDFNTEFGTREDFAEFVDQAHERGMYVILDWVANHTSPDHVWIANDGWHLRDSLGNLVTKYDWTDIAELDYSNTEMCNEMKKSMHWWMDTMKLDGFRCDVAEEIPTEFWNETVAELRAKHPKMFMLAEAEVAEHCQTAFDMYYGWELHHLMNGVAQGKKTVADFWTYFEKADKNFAPHAIRMNFTSNHDENSWNGTEFERMGDAYETMVVFSYFVPGMPLIYNGQEFGNSKRLQFFQKDTMEINHDSKYVQFYRHLNKVRKINSALYSPEKGGKMMRLECNNPNVFAAYREVGDNTVLGIFNFSNENVNVEIETSVVASEREYNDLQKGDMHKIEDKLTIEFKPWQYNLFVK